LAEHDMLMKGQSQEMTAEGSPPARILLVDDDHPLQSSIAGFLGEHNMLVVAASRRNNVRQHFAIREPDLVILDLQLREENGLDLLREIRAQSDVPVILTTDHRHDTIDRVVGLELGADDCMTKPVGLNELLARIRVILRRQETTRLAVPPDAEHRYRCFGGWRLDYRLRRLTDPNGTPVALTNREYNLLSAFLDAPQRPLSREHLLRATRIHEDIVYRSIDVQVLRLRRKLETDPKMVGIIRAERGVGYVFTLMVESV
jgi:two-component system OmpR family response regulator